MGFLLFFQRLRTYTKHLDTKLFQLSVGIAKGTCLRRAPPSAGYVIPTDEGRAIGATQHGVEINNQCKIVKMQERYKRQGSIDCDYVYELNGIEDGVEREDADRCRKTCD